MNSRLVTALRLASSPVAVFLTDEKADGALQFKDGAWGCVAATMVAVSKGRTAVFDRKTFGCPGGGSGLGFGNQYEQTDFDIVSLLSTGSPEGAARLQRRSRMAEGERFFKSPTQVRAWLSTVPFTDVPTEYVVMKPFDHIAGDERPSLLVFLVNPDQLSALVVLSDYQRGTGDSVVARFGGACQSILFGYAEARRDRPRGVIGFFDIAQRLRIDRELLSFTAPYSLFLEMEASVEGSFLEMEDWRELQARQGRA
jgi:uncharacterized protein (DUF169 family)